MPQTTEDRSVLPTVGDTEGLAAENASLQDRLLRALAEIENTHQRADRAVADARKFAVAEFARELLTTVDNLERTVNLSVDDATISSNVPLVHPENHIRA